MAPCGPVVPMGFSRSQTGAGRISRAADGLSNQEVLSLGAGANGTIWIGYRFGGGIDRVHLQPAALAVEKGVQRPGTDGLVYFLEFDASGRLWAGDRAGRGHWDGSRWSHYDTSDGLAWNDCNLNGSPKKPTAQSGSEPAGDSLDSSRVRTSRPKPPEVVFTKLVMGRKDVSGQRNPSFGIHSNSLDREILRAECSHDKSKFFFAIV